MKYLFVLTFLFSHISYSQESTLDNTYNYLADRLYTIGSNLDHFFSSDSTLKDYNNNTRIKLSFQNIISEYDKMTSHGDYRFELSLPNTQKKFQIVVERTPQDKKKINEENSLNEGKVLQRERETSAALQYILEESKLWRVRSFIGTKFALPPKLFYKGEMRRSFYFEKNHLYPDLSFYFEDTEGWTLVGSFHSDTEINKDYTFRWLNQWTWNSRAYTIEQTHGPSLYYTIDEKRALSYNFRAQGSTEPKEAINYYNVNVRYRQRIYSHWLFFEVSPQLEFKREDRFRRDANFITLLEAVIVKI